MEWIEARPSTVATAIVFLWTSNPTKMVLSVMTLLVSADKRCSEEQSTLRSRALVDMSGWVTHSMANISCGHDRLAGTFGASPPNTPSDTVRWRPRPFKLWPAHVRSDRDRRPAEPSRTSRPPAQSYPVRSAKQTIRTQIPVAPSAYRGIGSIQEGECGGEPRYRR